MRHVSHPGATHDILVGASIALYAYLAYWLAFMLVAVIAPQYARAASGIYIGGSISPGVAILASVANPVAEEFLYLGFVANALRKEGVGVALSVSVLLRVLVHLYQGPLAFVTNIPVGAVLAIYYLQTRRIWPAVVAHGFLDLVALSQLTT
jgi:membrane protease YdiL (CAAX protease family)